MSESSITAKPSESGSSTITRETTAWRPDQVPQVRKSIDQYRRFKRNLEAISELNQFLLRLDREESKQQEHTR